MVAIASLSSLLQLDNTGPVLEDDANRNNEKGPDRMLLGDINPRPWLQRQLHATTLTEEDEEEENDHHQQ